MGAYLGLPTDQNAKIIKSYAKFITNIPLYI